MNEREALMKQIMAYAFAAHDWNLYLDTHPNDREAISAFKSMAEKANQLKEEFVSKYAPISVTDVTSNEEWQWISSPWPWNE